MNFKNRTIFGWVSQLDLFYQDSCIYIFLFFELIRNPVLSKKFCLKIQRLPEAQKTHKIWIDNFTIFFIAFKFQYLNIFSTFCETFCQTFCQKASATEAEAEGKKASAFGRSFGLRSTTGSNINQACVVLALFCISISIA